MTAIAIMAIMSAIAAAASLAGTGINAAVQNKTNEENAARQAAVNKQSQYNIEHAHQIEMADLQAAGLNPVLTAMGGSGAPMATLNAPKAVAPQVDMSGVANAINGMTHMMMMSQLIDAKVDAADANANAKIQAAQISGQSRETVADKYINAGRLNNMLRNQSAGSALVGNAKQTNAYSDIRSMKEIAKSLGVSEKRLMEIVKMPWIYK